jgi:transposase
MKEATVKRRVRSQKAGSETATSRKSVHPWPLDVRKAVARAVVEDGLSVQRVADGFGVPMTTAAGWVSRYRKGGEVALSAEPKPQPAKAKRPNARHQAIIQAKTEHPDAGRCGRVYL